MRSAGSSSPGRTRRWPAAASRARPRLRGRCGGILHRRHAVLRRRPPVDRRARRLSPARLPSRRLQYEFALGGLQSRVREIASGATAEFVSSPGFSKTIPPLRSGDLALLRELIRSTGSTSQPPRTSASPRPTSLFMHAPWQHGDAPAAPTGMPGFRARAGTRSAAPPAGFFVFPRGGHPCCQPRQGSLHCAAARPYPSLRPGPVD